MVAAIVGATLVGGYLSSENQSDAATSAAQIQSDAAVKSGQISSDAATRAAQISATSADAATAERRRQFDIAQGLLKPWIDNGMAAMGGQKDLAGLNGGDPQAAAIAAIKGGPEFGATKSVGENAILSNASATGGLRGGNVNAALGQYDENLLSTLIDKQYARLTGISGQGQNAAAGVGTQAIATGAGIAGDLTGAGTVGANATIGAGTASGAATNAAAAAGAGGILGAARANSNLINTAVNAAGVYAGAQPAAPVTYAPNGVPYTGGFGGGPLFA